MKFRTTLILLVLNIAAILFFAFHTGSRLSDEEYDQQQKRVFPAAEYQAPGDLVRRFLANRVVRLELRHKTGTIILERNEPGSGAPWRIVHPIRTLADASQVTALLTTLELLEAQRTVSPGRDQPLDLKTHGLESPERSVSFATPEKSWTLNLGARTLDDRSLYVARADNPSRVFVVPATLLGHVSKTVHDLRDKAALVFTKAKVTGIELTARRRKLFACRLGRTGWRVTNPFDDEADIAELAALIDVPAKTRTEKFITDAPGRLEEFGLKNPILALTLIEGETRKTLLIGDKVKDRPQAVYAKRADDPWVFALPESSVGALLRTAQDLRAKTALPFAPSMVAAVTVEHAGKTSRLALEDNTWKFIEPAGALTDNEQVKTFLNQLVMLRVEKWIDKPDKRTLVAAGLTQPEAVLTLTLRGGVKRTLRFGKSDEKSAMRCARRDDVGPVLLVAPDFFDTIAGGCLAFMPRKMLEFKPGDVTALRIERPDGTFTLRNKDGTWRLTEPVKGRANAGAVRDLLWKISYVEAQKLVAVRPKDLTPYGLDKPRIKAIITIAPASDRETEERALLIGKTADRYSAFAMIAGRPVVFLISQEVVERLMAEFESKVDGTGSVSRTVVE